MSLGPTFEIHGLAHTEVSDSGPGCGRPLSTAGPAPGSLSSSWWRTQGKRQARPEGVRRGSGPL